MDRLRLDDLGGKAEAADQAGHHKASPRQGIAPQDIHFSHVTHGGRHSPRQAELSAS